MELYVYGNTRQLVGVVESFEYLRWTRRYTQCGAFELKAIATPDNIALLTLGHLLWKSDDEEVGIIEHLEMAQADKETITVSGRFATSLLARRIIWGAETLNGDLSACALQLINNHLIMPSDTNRQISSISFASSALGVTVNTQVSYKNLLDTVIGLCDASDRGIKTVFDPSTGNLSVALYNGAVSQAVFSREYENLTTQIYTQSAVDYANTALIGGEGEGASRVLVSIADSAGEARLEVFVDAKDLRQEDFGAGYPAALLYRGQNRLSELAMAHSFDAEVNPHGNLRYRVDFDLGQVVTVLSKKWGVTLAARITEIEESYDASGQTLNIVFGKEALSLLQKLKGG